MSYDYDDYANYDDNDYGGEEEDDNMIELENMFCEAEDFLRDGKNHEAMEKFQEIIEKEAELFPRIDERKQSFQSLKNLILLTLRENGELQKVDNYLTSLLGMFNYQSRNEGNEALSQIMDQLLNVEEEGVAVVFRHFINSLADFKLSQLYIRANMKLCRIHSVKGDINGLQQACQNIDNELKQIIDKERKEILQVELYAHYFKLYEMQGNFSKIKEVFRRLSRMNNNMNDQQMQGIISEMKGKINMSEGRYDHAKKYLLEAFQNYQDFGDQQAKKLLCIAVIASILEGHQMNIFDDLRARVYDNDPYVNSFQQIRRSYETNDIELFIQNKEVMQNDQFLKQFTNDIHRIMCLNKLSKIFKAYTRVKIQQIQTIDFIRYLSNIFKTNDQTIIKYVQELVITGILNAVIDEQNNCIEKIKEQSNTKINTLKQLVESVYKP